MTDGFEEFLRALKGNSDLRSKILNSKTAEDAVRHAKEAGHVLDTDKMIELYRQNAATQLSEEELEEVAGGKVQKGGDGGACKSYIKRSCN